ncbi:MAG: hypothetical protein H6Q90_4258 [Deltaproteobacteria bacterium]|nr:hypothetical protein [Deltaproteobacteria bacterium]
MASRWIPLLVVAVVPCAGVACHPGKHVSSPRVLPTPSVQVGACAEPGRDGVMGSSPRPDRADRDLDGDGRPESIVVDRAMCTEDGNCFWNVFVAPRAGSQDCSRYAGTFSGTALEPLASKGDDNMRDVRGYWNLHGGRLLLQSYRFARGGYRILDVLLCKRASDDKLECTDDRTE